MAACGANYIYITRKWLRALQHAIRVTLLIQLLRRGASFPLDGARGLRGDVIHDPVHAAHAVADAGRHVLQELRLEWIPAQPGPLGSSVLQRAHFPVLIFDRIAALANCLVGAQIIYARFATSGLSSGTAETCEGLGSTTHRARETVRTARDHVKCVFRTAACRRTDHHDTEAEFGARGCDDHVRRNGAHQSAVMPSELVTARSATTCECVLWSPCSSDAAHVTQCNAKCRFANCLIGSLGITLMWRQQPHPAVPGTRPCPVAGTSWEWGDYGLDQVR